jgi:ATP-binding cassette subfamily B multidrug efflux pump
MPSPMGMSAGKRVRVDKKETKAIVRGLLSYCKGEWVRIVIAFIAAIGGTILSVIGPNLLQKLTKLITEGISSSGIAIDLEGVSRLGYLMVILYCASFVLTALQGVLMNIVAAVVGKKLRASIAAKIDRMPLSYFDSHNYGDTLSLVTNDVDSIATSLSDSVSTLVSAVTMLLGSAIMMFYTNWILALSAIAATLIGFVFLALIMGRSQRYFTARQKDLAAVDSHVEEYFAGNAIVRAYNAEKKTGGDFEKKNSALRGSTFKSEFLSSLMMPIMSFVGNLGYVVVAIVGAALAFNGSIGFEVVIAFMLYVRLFTSPLSQLAQATSSLLTAFGASSRVFAFLNEGELLDESGKKPLLAGAKGAVAFDHVKFGYEKDKRIIQDFSLKVTPGEKIAIVGPTGAGKTTLVNLLMRFYEVDEGSISVDGVHLEDTTRENVHDLFAMVLQDTWLFEGTLRDNLCFGGIKKSDEELVAILKDAGLGHFYEALPKGLDTMLDESVTLSAGQRQLLTIARAMAKDAPMLILDEATSSVDTRTEIVIQEAMDKLMAKRTSFVIAHRLSTIRNASKILYLEGGDVKETGTHEELLKKNGAYARLYLSQFKQ